MMLRFAPAVCCALLSAAPLAEASTLQCSGTEPFWGLAISSDAITYDDADGTKLVLDPVAPRAAAGGSPDYISVYETKVKDGAQAYTIVVAQDDEGNCSDGMSDTNYPYKIVFIGSARVLNGCCLRK